MKLAVLMAGRVYGFERCVESQKVHVFKDHDVDIFLAHNDVNVGDNLPLFRTMYPVKAIESVHVDMSPYKHYSPDRSRGAHTLNSIAMFTCMDRAYSMIEDPSQYDMVLYMRADELFEESLDFKPVEPNTVYVPEGEDHLGLNDQLAYGTPASMKEYCSTIRRLHTIMETRMTAIHPETLNWNNVDMSGLSVVRFPLRYHLARNRKSCPKMPLLIEVGAYDGSDSLRFHSNGFQVFTFEPNRALYEGLVSRTQHLKHYTVSPKAVSLTNGTTRFNICASGGASSILPFRPDEELTKVWVDRPDVLYSGQSYEVETVRLDTFIEENGLQDTPIDYIHIDAQGVDLECLMSLGQYIRNVRAGVMETVMDPSRSIYAGQTTNTLENIQSYLSQNGFRITKIESNDVIACEYNVFFER